MMGVWLYSCLIFYPQGPSIQEISSEFSFWVTKLRKSKKKREIWLNWWQNSGIFKSLKLFFKKACLCIYRTILKVEFSSTGQIIFMVRNFYWINLLSLFMIKKNTTAKKVRLKWKVRVYLICKSCGSVWSSFQLFIQTYPQHPVKLTFKVHIFWEGHKEFQNVTHFCIWQTRIPNDI